MDDLELLIRDVRDALGDAMARGHTDLDVDALPALADAVPPPPEDRPEPVSRWGDLARESREEPLRGAAAMHAVREELGDCRRCGLCATRKQIVFGVGRPDADLVVIGEGPGEQEDLRGEPFVGPAGEMLDKMLENVLGLGRSEVYILNTVKCRPPGNRNPTPEELNACRPFLEGQIRALQPKMLLVLGAVAYKALLNTTQGITAARGKWHVWREPGTDREIPVMPTFHPAYLLRTPDDKRKTFEDLKAVRARYDAEGGRRPA